MKRRLAIACGFLAITSQKVYGKADAQISLLPVAAIESQADHTTISYELPCGAKLVGPILSTPNDGELQLGVLVEMPVTVCMGLGHRETLELPFLNSSHYLTVQSVAPQQYQQRPRLVPVTRVGVTSVDGGELLQLTYQSRCGRRLGTLVMMRAEQLAVGFLETQDELSDCQPQNYLAQLGPLAIGETPVVPFRDRPTNLSQVYVPRLTSIRNVRRLSTDEVQFEYARHCHEVGLGLVTRTLRDGRVAIGYAVAQFINDDCQSQNGSLFWERETTRLEQVTEAQRLVRLKSDFDPWSLRITQPTVKVLPAASTDGASPIMKMQFYRQCEQALGTLLQERADGSVAVAVLQINRQSSCNYPIKEVSWKQPAPAHEFDRDDVVPLKLKGI